MPFCYSLILSLCHSVIGSLSVAGQTITGSGSGTPVECGGSRPAPYSLRTITCKKGRETPSASTEIVLDPCQGRSTFS